MVVAGRPACGEGKGGVDDCLESPGVAMVATSGDGGGSDVYDTYGSPCFVGRL